MYFCVFFFSSFSSICNHLVMWPTQRVNLPSETFFPRLQTSSVAEQGALSECTHTHTHTHAQLLEGQSETINLDIFTSVQKNSPPDVEMPADMRAQIETSAALRAAQAPTLWEHGALGLFFFPSGLSVNSASRWKSVPRQFHPAVIYCPPRVLLKV